MTKIAIGFWIVAYMLLILVIGQYATIKVASLVFGKGTISSRTEAERIVNRCRLIASLALMGLIPAVATAIIAMTATNAQEVATVGVLTLMLSGIIVPTTINDFIVDHLAPALSRHSG